MAFVYALAGNASSFTVNKAGSDAAQVLNATALNRVTSGTDARRSRRLPLQRRFSLPSGADGPTGNGTPDATSSFHLRVRQRRKLFDQLFDRPEPSTPRW